MLPGLAPFLKDALVQRPGASCLPAPRSPFARHQVDHRVRCLRIELRAVGAFQARTRCGQTRSRRFACRGRSQRREPHFPGSSAPSRSSLRPPGPNPPGTKTASKPPSTASAPRSSTSSELIHSTLDTRVVGDHRRGTVLPQCSCTRRAASRTCRRRPPERHASGF